jgi:hypothetical protein
LQSGENMSRSSLLLAAVFGASLLARPSGANEPGGLGCPAYKAELIAAKTSLLRGDRRGTVEALRRAQEALAACIRESSEETALAASAIQPAESAERG